jgi:hypothetical protein
MILSFRHELKRYRIKIIVFAKLFKGILYQKNSNGLVFEVEII